MNKYYSLVQNGETADLNIYGDITSWAWEEFGEVSAVSLSRQLEQLQGVSNINVYINSYGGEVAEGLAIYNSLKRHAAKVTTHCDGFACSIASVIFMAGDVRVMNEASLLMIHNAWTMAQGNAKELRKQADDLEVITSASVAAYMADVSITEKQLRKMMDAETWLTPEQALEYGFCTSINKDEAKNPNQSAKSRVFEMLAGVFQADEDEDEKEDDSEVDTTDDETEDAEPDTGTDEDPETEDDSADDNEDETETEDEDGEDEKEKQFAFFRAIAKM